MKTTQAKTGGEAEAAPYGDDKRRRIAIALGHCMRRQGYAATSLTDIAVAAGMSPNLMRYYFTAKEDILELYYRLVSDRIMADILKLERASPEQWLAAFSAYSIVAGTERAALAILIEVFAVAMHHEPLARLKARYDSFMLRIYAEFFQWSGTMPGTDAYEAARIARALELGIKLSAAFQPDFDSAKAEAMLLAEMRRLAGLARPAPRKRPIRRTHSDR